jgi:hypothetical protein
MKFTDTLKSLEAKATDGPVTVNSISAHPSFSYAQHPEYQFQARNGDVQIYAFLRNHAKEIINLVEAAEQVITAPDDDADVKAYYKLANAIDALNKEQPDWRGEFHQPVHKDIDNSRPVTATRIKKEQS